MKTYMALDKLQYFSLTYNTKPYVFVFLETSTGRKFNKFPQFNKIFSKTLLKTF